jgi:hypothetical protein
LNYNLSLVFNRVIRGVYGNREDRKKRLANDGYNFEIVIHNLFKLNEKKQYYY